MNPLAAKNKGIENFLPLAPKLITENPKKLQYFPMS
jgi:hypothetical protein